MRFQCTRCALCCGDTENRSRHILLLREDAETISRASSKPVEIFATESRNSEPYVYEMRKTGGEGKCFFLEGRNCSVYGLRPLICRFYPFELVRMKDGKHRFFSTQECPGIGKGNRLERGDFENLFKRACAQLERKKTGKT
jgi:Fe-S-cluster containining protein